MSVDEAMRRIEAAGWGGVSVWQFGPTTFNACLIDRSGTVDHDTNLWNYTETAEAALEAIVEKAERFPELNERLSERG